MAVEFTQEDVLAGLKNVYDPEIGINIVDLGLVYDAEIAENGDVLGDHDADLDRLSAGSGHRAGSQQRPQGFAGDRANRCQARLVAALVARPDDRRSQGRAGHLVTAGPG